MVGALSMSIVSVSPSSWCWDLHRQDPSEAHPQLDYGFASRPIAHRLTVRALNAPKDWGPSDHCRIVIDLEET